MPRTHIAGATSSGRNGSVQPADPDTSAAPMAMKQCAHGPVALTLVVLRIMSPTCRFPLGGEGSTDATAPERLLPSRRLAPRRRGVALGRHRYRLLDGRAGRWLSRNAVAAAAYGCVCVARPSGASETRNTSRLCSIRSGRVPAAPAIDRPLKLGIDAKACGLTPAPVGISTARWRIPPPTS